MTDLAMEDLGCDVWKRRQPRPKFDCNSGAANWYHGWSAARKAWCCQNMARGCMLYHCEGKASDLSGWSVRKRDWCCHFASKGCSQAVVLQSPCGVMCFKWLGSPEKHLL